MNDLRGLSDLVLSRSSGLALYARQWVDRSDAQDVVQTALVALLSEKKTPDDPIAWMYRAVRNAAIDSHRADKRRLRRELAIAIKRPDWFKPTPSDAIDAASAEAALRNLTEQMREVVVLRLWGDLNFTAIAKITGVSVSTVHGRYSAALKLLRGILEEPCKTTNLNRD